MFEKARIRRDWVGDFTDAWIHAFIGENCPVLTAKVGRCCFVVLRACEAMKRPACPDANVVSAACDAVHELVGEVVIDPVHRDAILAGLAAAHRLQESVGIDAIFNAACDMEVMLLNTDGLRLEDFKRLVA